MNHEQLNKNKKKYGKDFIGNVIRITDNRTIIINVGKNIVSVGNIIQVYEIGDTLKDIDDRELGVFYFIKDELQVIRTEEQYSVCKKMDFVETDNFALSPLLHKQKEYLPLHIHESDIQELKPKDSYIRIGDPIKLA